MRLPPLRTRVVTAEQMAALDRATIQGRGVPSLALMERAGREVARRATSWWRETGARYGRPGSAAGESGSATAPEARSRAAARGAKGAAARRISTGGQVIILAGPGNNGGDGFVVARYLKSAGFAVRVLVAAAENAISTDAAANRDACVRARIPVTFLPDPRAWGPAAEAAVAGRGAVFLVDALLGTGSKGAPRGAVAAAIEMAGETGRPIVSIDIPSGVDASTGHAESPAIRAALTVTLGLPKLGQVLEPGKSHAGALETADIGIPADLVADQPPALLIADAAWVRSLLPVRPTYAHKGSMGRVLVVGGSAGMMGAAAMTGESVLRSGAGYAVAAVPRSCVDALEARVAEVVKRGMPETDARTLARAALDPILEEAMRADVVAIGPGASRHPETEELIRELVERVDCPIVLDADGLNAFEGRSLPRRRAPLIVSPHYGEAARLAGATVADVARDPAGWARRFATSSGAIVCLKATPMITAAPGEPLILNATGNAGMATAGAGDSLTGAISGLLAQGMEAAEAAAAGCYVHGLAGDVAARRKGMRGMIAGDIKDAIPAALLSLEIGAMDER
ncbi:MAG TPA: NAD(P)H-hydrate dehydratase [Candidatus Eisenbacteria bacterium]